MGVRNSTTVILQLLDIKSTILAPLYHATSFKLGLLMRDIKLSIFNDFITSRYFDFMSITDTWSKPNDYGQLALASSEINVKV